MTIVKKLLLVNTRWGTTANAQPWDPTIVTGLCAGARAFWSEVSFGQIDLQCTPVQRFVQVSDDGGQASSSGGGILQIQGPPQLAAIGYDASQYDWVYYLTPMTYGYDFPGWIQYGDPELLWKFIHEIGHHFGLQHVGRVSSGYSLSGYDVHITGMPGWSSTGGTTSPMGYSHRITGLNAGEKIGLGLIPFATWDGQDRTYTLTPLNQPGGALYAVRIPGKMRGYIVEHRELIGVDSVLPGTGLVVHYDLMTQGIPPYGFPYGIQVPGSDNGTEVMGLWGTLTDADAGIAIQYAGDGKVRVYNPGAIVAPPVSQPPPVRPATSGNSQMLIDTIKAQANALAVGGVSQAMIDALKASVASLVPDAGSVPPGAFVDSAGDVWTLGAMSLWPPNPWALRNGSQPIAGGGAGVELKAWGNSVQLRNSPWNQWWGFDKTANAWVRVA